jgi:hypothetical protein
MIGLALVITLVSAIALNWGYLREHEAAGTLPALSIRRPLRTARLLLANRRWLTGFAAETAGWGLFVLALALAPLALVQAVSAGGIGILAALVSRFRLTRLTPRERLGVGLSVAGLGLLGVSLTGGVDEGSEASWLALGLWLAASVVIAGLIVGAGRASVRGGPAFGAATGVMFGAGDVATKATVGGDIALAPAVIASYGAGTLLLQMGFQRGGALVTAGLATLFTNAIPIAAGMTIFHEPLPGGAFGVIRAVAFITVIVSAIVLARKAPDAGNARERTLGDGDLARLRDAPPRAASPAPLARHGTPTIQRRRRLGRPSIGLHSPTHLDATRAPRSNRAGGLTRPSVGDGTRTRRRR